MPIEQTQKTATHPPVANAARGLKESRIRRLTIEALRYQATNLAQAFPDYSPPRGFVEILMAAASSGRHQYTDTWGASDTRTAVAEYVHRFHALVKPDPDRNVLLTIGAMEAMNDALFVALDPGDEAVVLEPFYECFVAQIVSRHGIPKYVRLDENNHGGFDLDLDRLERMFTSRTRAVIVNTPSNPGGKVFSRDELQGIVDICRRHRAWLISDETYEQIYFDGNKPTSVIDVDPDLLNSVVVSGFGKTFAVTGWRIGYLLASEEFMRYVRPAHDVNTICAVSHVQEALASLVASPESYFDAMRQEYDDRRQFLSTGLKKLGFGVNNIEGAYYILARVPEWWNGTGAELNTRLISGGFVAGVPGEVFYGPGGGTRFIRYTFCKQRATLEMAIAHMEAAFSVLRRVECK